MPYELFIALRYLRAKRRQSVLSVITFISMIGIAVGVWALVIVLAFQSGMEKDLQNKILGGTAHLNLMREDESPIPNAKELAGRLEKLTGVKAASSTVYFTVLVSGPNSTQPAVLKAVDMSARPEANEVNQTLKEGSLAGLKTTESGETGIIIGREMADALALKVGDTITVISPEGRLTPAGLAPRQKILNIVGIFQSGLFEYDSSWAYVSMETARELILNQEVESVIQINVNDIYGVKEVAAAVIGEVGPGFKTRDWQQLNQPVFAALNLQRLGFFVGIGLIILVASLNIITTLIMMVVEKNRDIAILMSMGATGRSVLLVFMTQGLIIGIVGMLIGGVAGAVSSWLADTYRLITLDPRIYSISYVPFELRPLDIVSVMAMVMTISFLATIYPAWKASRLIPVEGLRYE